MPDLGLRDKSASGLSLIIIIIALLAFPTPALSTLPVDDELDRLWKMENQAADLMEAKQWDASDRLYQQVMAGYLPILGSGHKAIGRIWFNLGLIELNRKRYEKAETCFLSSLAIREKALGPNHLLTGTVLNELGWLKRVAESYGQAAAYYQRSKSIFETELTTADPVGVKYLETLALQFKTQKMLLFALDLRRAITMSRKFSKQPTKPDAEAKAAYIKKEIRQALLSAEKTRRTYDAHLKAGRRDRARLTNTLTSAYGGLGYCLARSNRRAAAIPYLEKAYLLFEVLAGPTRIWSIMARSELRQTNELLGRHSHARLLQVRGSLRRKWQETGSTRAPDVLDKFTKEIARNAMLQQIGMEIAEKGADSKGLIGVYALIAPISAKMGKLEEAAEYSIRSLEIQQKHRRPSRPGSASSGTRSGTRSGSRPGNDQDR